MLQTVQISKEQILKLMMLRKPKGKIQFLTVSIKNLPL